MVSSFEEVPARDLGHVGYVRGELHDERALRGGAAPGYDRLDAVRARADGHAARIHVRARDVHLVRVHRRVFQRLDHLHVLVETVA